MREGLLSGIVAGSLKLSESSGKTSHTVSQSFLISFSIMLTFWFAKKEKGSGDGKGVY